MRCTPAISVSPVTGYLIGGYLIGVHLIGAIGVVSGHLIGVCLRHQVWRSVSILVSEWMEYRHFSAILGSYRYSVYFCQACFLSFWAMICSRMYHTPATVAAGPTPI